MPALNPALNRSEKSLLRKASHVPVETITLKIKNRYFPKRRWAKKSNRYTTNCIKNLKADSSSSRLKMGDISEYIAASPILHCADSWSFLGRALDSHLKGDNSTARHLAYYSELRAAVSLLATQGVGIFDRKHFVLTQPLICRPLNATSSPAPKATHVLTWLALKYWGDRVCSGDFVSLVICPAKVSLKDWLTEFGAASSAKPIGSEWLRSWGLDLKLLSVDRDARNEASYRPSRLNEHARPTTKQRLDFLLGFWKLLEPSEFSRFETLDRYLLRYSLEKAYYSITGRKPIEDMPGYMTRIEKMLGAISPKGLSNEEWGRFLSRQSEPDDPILIKEAFKRESIYSANHHMQVIARALLLLRISSGACAKLVESCGISKDLLRFWWTPVGEDVGLWDVGGEPTAIMDLWAEIDSAVSDLTAADTNASMYLFRKKNISPLSILAECERAALWSVGL